MYLIVKVNKIIGGTVVNWQVRNHEISAHWHTPNNVDGKPHWLIPVNKRDEGMRGSQKSGYRIYSPNASQVEKATLLGIREF